MYDACVPWPERPKGAKDKSRGPKGLELEVWARRAPKLLFFHIFSIFFHIFLLSSQSTLPHICVRQGNFYEISYFFTLLAKCFFENVNHCFFPLNLLSDFSKISDIFSMFIFYTSSSTVIFAMSWSFSIMVKVMSLQSTKLNSAHGWLSGNVKMEF